MQKKQLKILGKQNDFSLSFFSTILGVVCKDGIVIGTEKLIVNKM
jgi:20S proteasome alpha/beta subunit